MEKSIEKAMHLGVDFWKAKLFRSHEKSKKIKLSQRLTAKRYVNESKVRGGFLCRVGVGGGVNPSPREEGKGEVGSYQYSTLNHLSPGAVGISYVVCLSSFFLSHDLV